MIRAIGIRFAEWIRWRVCVAQWGQLRAVEPGRAEQVQGLEEDTNFGSVEANRWSQKQATGAPAKGHDNVKPIIDLSVH